MPVNLSFSTECVKDRSACKVGQCLMGGYFKNKKKREGKGKEYGTAVAKRTKRKGGFTDTFSEWIKLF